MRRITFSRKARYQQAWNGHVAVLSPDPIPTTDYYLTPRLNGIEHTRFDSRALDAAIHELPTGTFVVIVRHAARSWLRALERERQRWSGVAFLMDDDIPDAWRCADVPLDYGLWTSGRYWGVRDVLSKVCDQLWVSTPVLAQRYPGSRIVPPLPFAVQTEPAPVGTRRWGYHGTRIHRRELKWIVPIVRVVQERVTDAVFEVFGDESVRGLFAGIPRVEVLPPRSWPDYLAHCQDTSLAVMLAPLLPGRFNAARAHTKLFDAARCGAVGVFSARAPYDPLLKDVGGSLLLDDPSIWAKEAIRLLLDDAERLARHARMMDWIRQAAMSVRLERLIVEGEKQ